MSAHEPGSVSDITMFRDRQDIHAAALVKDASESVINNNGELFQDFPASWYVLNGSLDRHDLERNANVSSDRVIVENFFGRVCLLWKISYATFVWGTKCYDAIQRLTFALTNYHLTLMPLRQYDQHQYRAVMARYRRMVEENNVKRAAIQRRYAASGCLFPESGTHVLDRERWVSENWAEDIARRRGRSMDELEC
ncbi:hypothetical protein H257_19295 [Aphanomyces astaci]|uniref:DDE Tnp4 domain-containing protein n=1 Tax=Aphanomyces astaci TaxID=112090 RepID=W4FAN3_APHAT|nr:hypothetical protein H257_19295 [Aphanomyces astaci]ETV63773.1 hypothetical protein H257_19295 [Aphanomyces astaci]|eukprot:XP_009846742.1 hypothetical protein H257_19295 [Aphanomyces astaci]